MGSMALGLTAFANADTLIFSHVTASQSAPFSDAFTLGGFQVGTNGVALTAILNSITIGLTETTTASVNIFNATASPQAYSNANSSVPIAVTGPGPTSLNFNAVAGPFSGTAAVGQSVIPGSPVTQTTSVNVLAANFGLYTSGPTVSLTFATSTGAYSGSAVPGVFFGGDATSGGTVTITYNYTVPSTTPEPASMLLLGSALVGMGLLGRKKIRK